MTYQEAGEESVRKEVYDTMIKQMANYSYKWKQLVSVVPTSAWKSYFFRETTTIPSGPSGNATKGLPRGADFPNAVMSWDKVQSVIEKYGLKMQIDYEDIVSNNIDIRDRTMLRIAEGVAKAVDEEISIIVTENWTATNIQSDTISAGYWNQSSAAIVKDIAKMKAKIKTYYDNAKSFVLVTNPSREPEVLHYIYEKGAQAGDAGQSAFNGVIGKPAGVEYMTSSVVPASYAVVLVPKTCATWKELVPLGTDTEVKKFIGDKITACEMGVTELHEPLQVCIMQILA